MNQMKFVLFCILFFSIRGQANTYLWYSMECSIGASQQSMSSPVVQLQKISFTVRASAVENDDGKRAVLKKGFLLERPVSIPVEEWEPLATRMEVYLSQWQPGLEKTGGAHTQVNLGLDYEGLYVLLRSLGGLGLDFSDDLNVSDRLPKDGLGIYNFSFGSNYVSTVQLHLPPEQKEGLSFHVSWVCSPFSASTNPMPLGNMGPPLPPAPVFFPKLESSTSQFDGTAFSYNLKANDRVHEIRFSVDGQMGTWNPVSSVIRIVPKDPLKFVGTHKIEIQYRDIRGIKSSMLIAEVVAKPPKYIEEPLIVGFHATGCYGGYYNGYMGWVSDGLIPQDYISYRWRNLNLNGAPKWSEWNDFVKDEYYLKFAISIGDARNCYPRDISFAVELKDPFGFVRTINFND